MWRHSAFTIFVFFVLCHCFNVDCLSQDDLSYIAKNLEIKYEVVDNIKDPLTFTSQLTFINRGNSAIKPGSWEIYFNFIRLIEPQYLRDNPDGYVIPKVAMKITHVVGSLFKIQPIEGFQELQSNQTVSFQFESQDFSVSKYDVMPNWYVTAEGLKAENIVTTSTLDFVGKFDTKEKWKRTKSDLYNPMTVAERYRRGKVDKKKPELGSILPTPVETKIENKYVSITGWGILAPRKFLNEANYLAEKVNLLVRNRSDNLKTIRLLQKNVSLKFEGKNFKSNEMYEMKVEENTITIAAAATTGIFYGIQSLLAVTDVKTKEVLKVSVKDAPRFEYRGFMLDISRNFHGKKSIIKIMNVMAKYKLNKLHLHMSDDEAWRLDIPGLPELTSFGSQRCYNVSRCLGPQLGSGAFNTTSGSGYLTVEDYRDILRVAKTLHIEIIPEFDMPGHSHAAIKAMQYRFREKSSSSNESVETASEFLLDELNDPSQYFSVQMFRDNAINPCLNSVYKFVEHILSFLVSVHSDINPLSLYHMGGDEVAKGAWRNSSACGNLTTSKQIMSLKTYFTKKIAKLVNKYNLSLGAWEDGLMEGKNPFNKTEVSENHVYAYTWNNVWEWGEFDRAYRLANAGYKTVLSHATHLYFDMPYEPNPSEPGYYWATRFIDTMKVFGYLADSVYDNAKRDRFGKSISKQELCKKERNCPVLTKKGNIVGMQGNLWSETVRNEEQLHYMVFPRLLALAERSWHKGEFENDETLRHKKFKEEWQIFANLLGHRELLNLDEMNIHYRVPLPGVMLVSGRVEAITEFPGLKIEYNIGNKWVEYTSPLLWKAGKIKFRTKSADGKRSSKEVEYDISTSSQDAGLHSNMMSIYITGLFIFYNSIL